MKIRLYYKKFSGPILVMAIILVIVVIYGLITKGEFLVGPAIISVITLGVHILCYYLNNKVFYITINEAHIYIRNMNLNDFIAYESIREIKRSTNNRTIHIYYNQYDNISFSVENNQYVYDKIIKAIEANQE